MDARYADARYADGRAAITRPASFVIGPEALDIEAAGARLTWAYADLRRADDNNGEIILKRAPDTGERLIFSPELGPALQAAAPALFNPRAQGGESPVLVGWLAGAALSIGAAFLIGVPLAAEPLARVMPAQYQQQVGQIARAQLESLTDYCEASRPADEALTDLAFRLLQAAHTADDDALSQRIEVSVVRAPFPNAFALPDDTIVVTDALIAAAEHPDEIAGVLAHEIAHLSHHHVMANVIRNIGAGVFFDIIFGGAGLGQAVAIASVNLASLGYTRGDEAEADRAALNYLDAAGVDPAALARFFDRIAEISGEAAANIPAMLSSHPRTAERAAAARARARPGRAPALTDADWQLIRNACGSAPASMPSPALAPKPGAVPPVNKGDKPV